MPTTDLIAIYAAVVATGSLCWQAFVWWRAGARLTITVMPQALIINSLPGDEEDQRLHCIAYVTNRGDRPTTITHFGFRPARRFWGVRRKGDQYLVAHPYLGSVPNVPKQIGPGEIWTGISTPPPHIRKLIDEGKLNVTVNASHRDRAFEKRIPRKKP